MRIVKNLGAFAMIKYLDNTSIVPIVQSKVYFPKNIELLLARGDNIKISMNDADMEKVMPRIYFSKKAKVDSFYFTINSTGEIIIKTKPEQVVEKIWMIACRNGRNYYLALKNGKLYYLKEKEVLRTELIPVKITGNIIKVQNCIISPAALYWGYNYVDDITKFALGKKMSFDKYIEKVYDKKPTMDIECHVSNDCKLIYSAMNHGKEIMYVLVDDVCNDEGVSVPHIIVGKKLGNPLENVSGVAIDEDGKMWRWKNGHKEYEIMDSYRK